MNDYEWLVEMNICPKCHKSRPAPGRRLCFDCLEKERERSARRTYTPEEAEKCRCRKRKAYKEKKAAGICLRCSKPATHGLHCYEHSIAVKRYHLKGAERRAAKRREMGLDWESRKENGQCRWCGEPAVAGLQCCEKHRRILSDAGRKGYEANVRNGNNKWINEVIAWKKRNGWQPSPPTCGTKSGQKTQ